MKKEKKKKEKKKSKKKRRSSSVSSDSSDSSSNSEFEMKTKKKEPDTNGQQKPWKEEEPAVDDSVLNQWMSVQENPLGDQDQKILEKLKNRYVYFLFLTVLLNISQTIFFYFN